MAVILNLFMCIALSLGLYAIVICVMYITECLCKKRESKYKYKISDDNQVTMWVGRYKNGKLFLHIRKPHKEKNMGEWNDNDYYEILELSNKLFPSVKWEDAEPTEVVLTLKK